MNISSLLSTGIWLAVLGLVVLLGLRFTGAAAARAGRAL